MRARPKTRQLAPLVGAPRSPVTTGDSRSRPKPVPRRRFRRRMSARSGRNTDPAERLLRRAPVVRRHLRRASVVAIPLAVLTVAQGFALAALAVAVSEYGRFDAVAAGVLVAAALARGLGEWGLERSGRRAAAEAVGRLRAGLMTDAAVLSVTQPAALRPGEIATDVVHSLPAVEDYVARALPERPIALATVALVLAGIAWVDPLSAALLLPAVPLLIGFLWFARGEAQAAATRLRTLQLLGAHLLDVTRGLLDLRAFGRAGHQRSQVGMAAENYQAQTAMTLKFAVRSALVVELVAVVGVALVAVSGGVRLASGTAQLAAILPALLLAPQCFAPFRRLGAGQRGAADAHAVLDRVVAVHAAAGAAPVPGHPSGPPPPRPGEVAITLDHVTVGAADRDGRLRDVCLSLPPGVTTALVGPSGAGKTSLALLVLGLLGPTSGRVLAGGAGLAGMNLGPWRNRCAWVPQDPHLLPATLRDNVRLARPSTTDDEVLAALVDAGLGALTAELPHGLETPLGEGGVQLSGGEMRRLALARALLNDPDLLVLDEPTAQLDARTAARLMGTIRRLAAGRTTLLITHDSSLARVAHQVVTLQRGAVVSVVAGEAARPQRQPAVAAPGASESMHAVASAAELTAMLGGSAAPPGAGEAPRSSPFVGPRLWTALKLIAPPRHDPRWGRAAWAIGLGVLAAVASIAVFAVSTGLIVRAATQPPVLGVTVLIVLVQLVAVLGAVARYGGRRAGQGAVLCVLVGLRVRVFDHVARHVPGARGDRPAAALDAAVGDVERVADLLTAVFVPAMATVVAIIAATAVAVVVSPVAGLAIGGGCLSLGALVGLLAHRAGRGEAEAHASRARLTLDLIAALTSGTELLLAGRTDDARNRVLAGTAALEASAARHGTRAAALTGCVSTGAAALAVLVAGLMAPQVGSGALTGAVATALVLGALATAAELDGVVKAGLAVPAATGAVGRLAGALLDLEESAPHVAPAADLHREPMHTAPTSLCAEGLWLERGGRLVLRGASLQLAAGERLAITGERGSGKSSLLLVVAGLLHPTGGAVRQGGVDLLRDTDDVRARGVLLVPSVPHLYGGTLAANLRLAAPGASDEDLSRALRAVGLGSWVRALPRGLDTLLGEGGVTASLGERQRIGLARAFLSPARVVLLDEPASHLAEAAALDALRAVLSAGAGRAAVLVAYRPAEQRLASRELRLEQGRLETPRARRRGAAASAARG